MKERILQQNGKEYWRSVEEFVDAPEFEEFVKYEYPAQAEEWDSSVSRRNFIKVMGASLALAGLSGCVIQPTEKIVPYVNQPEGLVPGKPMYYATAMTLGGVGNGLLARSNEGRPTKLEGNPEHPGSLGSTDVLTQAALLDLYDPDRSQEIVNRGEPKTWQAFMNDVRVKVEDNRANGGAGVRFLTETISSPTLIAQFNQLKTELPNAKWYQYEPLNKDNVVAGAKLAFGSAVNTVYKFDQAERVLTLDADIFSGFNIRYIKDFAKSRAWSEEKKHINRLYAVETTMSLTGAKADHRLAVKPSQMTEIAKAVAKAVGVAGATSNLAEFADWIAPMAKDLKEHAGKSLVVVGDNQPAAVHAIAHAINETLGNVGKTVVYTEPTQANAETLQIEGLRELVKDIDAGVVKMLVVFGGNPVYNTPADLKLNAERLNKIPYRVHLGRYRDETAELCQWHVGEKHFLEGWSDTRAYDGTVSIVQPLIDPLYSGKSAHEVLQLFFKENFEKKDYDIVREYWQKQTLNMAVKPVAVEKTEAKPEAKTDGKTEPKTEAKVETPVAPAAKTAPAATPSPTTAAPAGAKAFDQNWRRIVHDGVVPNSQAAVKEVKVNPAFMGQAVPATSSAGAIEISILPDPSVYDGRFTNNGWLQELPNPLTKITWENVALVSPKTAAKLGLNRGNDADEFSGGERPTAFINSKGGNMFSDLVKLKFQGGEISKPVPVWIAPGQPDDVVAIYLGYGRTKAGRVGTDLGYNAYDVRRSDAMYFGSGEITKTGEQTTIASTQIHFNMEGRDLLRVWDLEEFNADEKLGEQHNEIDKTMYQPELFEKGYAENHRWGMAIDLNSCVGCNACVIACQSENNIPIVGKEQVERSREMHWMRVDAYFGGTLEKPEGPNFQPVLCQQCEQAPCEVVCPVHATVHSVEGLNDMVYNRCIGTRYCSNNCPYKVRRFNFLLYQDWDTAQFKLMRNPEVTVRSRGVMEKCTYCTQRIAAARIEAEKDGRKVRDGEVVTACQAACPAEAIAFGDLNDKSSKVSKLKADRRDYNLLNELNTQPRTTYLAGLKNQNKEMPGYVAPKKKDGESKTAAH
ncbi:MAG: TAT-variant-translocated molybdopterin oxidoreductase [Acidobacteria bacterium]|nr:TAT-variant-translocated molybdopterin oxidoreductase [Acidobacteriota bacterium]